MRQQEDAGQDHRAEGVDMFQRIEGDAAELPGGAVAEQIGDKTVRRLMEGDGDQ